MNAYMKGSTYYDILGVKQNASLEEIKDAYKKKQSINNVSMWHPNWSEGRDTYQRARQIHDAYSILSNQALRTSYDSELLNYNEQQRKNEEIARNELLAELKNKTDAELVDIYLNARIFDVLYINDVLQEIKSRNYTNKQLPNTSSENKSTISQPNIVKPLSWLQRLKKWLKIY